MDRHRRLAILGGAEDLAFLSRDRGIAFDDRRHHAAERFHAQRQRRHVQQQDILHLA